MKINYIQYHNYRCFLDAKVCFDITDKQNIALVLGVNGSGKTEMLFSFQWILYGFDFKNLREKDETPYSLNSALYHKLETEPHAPSVDCWAELSFTHNGTDYFMKRTERFMRLNDKIKFNDSVSLSYTKENGERSTPEKDKAIVEEKLTRIIPKSILEGITFDGERMKKLNIVDDSSKKVIKNVISLVTNERLFELCLGEIKDVNGDISRERNKINKASGNASAEELEDEISQLNDDIEDAEAGIVGAEKNLQKVETNIIEVSQKLAQLEDAKQLEQKRKGLERDLDRAQKEFTQGIDLFQKRLLDGYFLVTDQLVDDVKKSLESIDVPAGLTVEAVRSIMKRPKCICGCNINDDIIQKLTTLLSTLPPDNISSNILYMANQFAGEKKKAKDLLKEAYDSMRKSKDEVAKIKSELADVSSSLVTSVSETVRDLEQERNKLFEQKGRLNDKLEKHKYELKRYSNRLKEANKELEETSGNQKQIKELMAKGKVLDKFKDAIKRIGELNQSLSLVSINEYLSRAYSLLSEDTGRRIYLCQFNEKEKYSLLTYLQSRYSDIRIRWTNSGRILTLEDDGLSEKEIHELIVLQVAEGKSTGQSKINSLAFAKAVLEYSNEDRSSDSLKVSHDYPFLIDSPFTELSDENLMNVAKYINTFAGQVLIMADDTSYSGVEQFLKPFVKTKTQLIKDKEKGISYVK
jgi:DNA sulfur modification protein DndD